MIFERSLCGKCDIILSYIYAYTTKLELHLSYLVRLDSNAFNWWIIAILAEICTKCVIFIEKLQKNSPRAGDFATRSPLPSAARGWPPIPHWEFLATPLLHAILLMMNIKQENCEYQLFKSFGPTRRDILSGAQDSSHW